MSLFGFTKGGSDKPQRYVDKSAFQENLARQTAMSPQTVAQLREYGVAELASLKLEFFFYTDKKRKGAELAKALQDLGYQAECGPATGNPQLILTTGWTTAIQIGEAPIVAWTEKMCRLGYEHDCDFDGWGTNPNQ